MLEFEIDIRYIRLLVRLIHKIKKMWHNSGLYI